MKLSSREKIASYTFTFELPYNNLSLIYPPNFNLPTLSLWIINRPRTTLENRSIELVSRNSLPLRVILLQRFDGEDWPFSCFKIRPILGEEIGHSISTVSNLGYLFSRQHRRNSQLLYTRNVLPLSIRRGESVIAIVGLGQRWCCTRWYRPVVDPKFNYLPALDSL